MDNRRYLALRVLAVVLLLLALPACGASEEAAHSGGEKLASSAGKAQSVATRGEQLAADQAVVPASGDVNLDFDRKVIKTAELGIRVGEVRRAAAQAQQLAARYGGSVLSSRIDQGNGSISANLVLSVPSPEFEKALDELRSLGEEVTTDAVTGEDVTEEFVDLEARERNLLAAEQSLLDLYDEVKSVEDALSIERELANIRDQIEQVQGRIEYLESRTSFSQIVLDIRPVAVPGSSWDVATVVAEAWEASLAVLQTLATAVISAVVFGWWLAPALVAGIVLWRRRNRSPATSPPRADGSG
jgi:hypothetical protein